MRKYSADGADERVSFGVGLPWVNFDPDLEGFVRDFSHQARKTNFILTYILAQNFDW